LIRFVYSLYILLCVLCVSVVVPFISIGKRIIGNKAHDGLDVRGADAGELQPHVEHIGIYVVPAPPGLRRKRDAPAAGNFRRQFKREMKHGVYLHGPVANEHHAFGSDVHHASDRLSAIRVEYLEMADKASPLEFPPVLHTRHLILLLLFLTPALDTKIMVLDRLVLVLEIERLPQVIAICIPRFLKAFFGIAAGNTKSQGHAKRRKGNKTFHKTSFK
jgi:hypothetical protein